MRRLALLLLLLLSGCGSVTRPGGQASTALSLPALQYRLVDSVGPPVYCDPLQYPVARTVDPAEAARLVSDLRTRHPEEFDAIVRHEHLDPAKLSPSDDLHVLGQASLLAAIPLTAQGGGYAFRYEVSGPSTAEVTGTIDTDGTIRVASRTPAPRRPCPLCLAQWTRIATPAGDVPVTEVRTGTIVWTLDRGGQRVAAPVLDTGDTPTSIGHRLVHLVLTDGRTVDVSPGHPLPDGRPVGSIRAGDVLDGSVVASADLRSYAGSATWDLLPAGVTHVYWADGVPLGSTLADRS